MCAVMGADETNYREVSADTMKLLLPVRRGAGDDKLVLGMRPNQIAIRICAAARQAGLGVGYSGDSPRLVMIKDMQTLGVSLLGDTPLRAHSRGVASQGAWSELTVREEPGCSE